MPRGKKKSATESVAAEVATETAVSVKKTAKPTKAKAVPTTNKSAAKTAKKTVKKAETKTAAPKTKSTAPKAAPKPTKKTATAKTSAPAPKRSVKKTAKGKSDEVFIQSNGKDYTLSEITQICKDAYRGGTRKQIKSIKIYVKAEKNKLVAYYVVNDSVNGSTEL